MVVTNRKTRFFTVCCHRTTSDEIQIRPTDSIHGDAPDAALLATVPDE